MDLRGASAESVAALTDQLKASVSGSVTAAATAADSLFSVAQTLRDEPALRRFATDASVPVEARQGLVGEVFGGKLDPSALDVVSDAVSRRWTHARDLADGIQRLSEVAAVLSAGDQGGQLSDELFAVGQAVAASPELRDALSEPGRSDADKSALLEQLLGGKLDQAALDIVSDAVSRRWTHARDLADGIQRLSEVAAVLSAGEQGGQLSDELFAVGQTVAANPELRDALSEPGRNDDDKSELLERLLGGKALAATVSLAKQALSGTYGTFTAALSSYRRLAADVHGRSVATVRVASALPDAQVERLTAALAAQYGRPVHANVVIDPAVIGGIRVEIGDDVIDGTIASRLDEAGRKLAG